MMICGQGPNSALRDARRPIPLCAASSALVRCQGREAGRGLRAEDDRGDAKVQVQVPINRP